MIKPYGTWYQTLLLEFGEPYFKELEAFIDHERKEGKVIYPDELNIFRALNLTTPSQVRVVILGQDPYHQPSMANGLAFASYAAEPKKFPASLRNILRALKIDTGIDRKHADLAGWAHQGVLLLNTVLTVERGKPNSHANKGWEKFTDAVLNELVSQSRPMVFMLWGEKARAKRSLIAGGNPKHLILETSHPSPLSVHRGFLFSKHFSQANLWLKYQGEREIDWRL